jgi:hypothetical protein
MPLLLIIKSALGAIAMYYLKRNAPELLVDVGIESLDELAQMSETKIDDDAVSKLREDREFYIQIIRGFM